MNKFTYWEYNSVRDPIASTIKKTFDRVSPSSMWGQIADECAEKIVNEIVDANRPGMWFEWINPNTVNEIQFICADPTRTDEPQEVSTKEVELEEEKEPPRCKDCGERLPEDTEETFCGDDCEENYERFEHQECAPTPTVGESLQALDANLRVVAKALQGDFSDEQTKQLLEEIAGVLWYDGDGHAEPDKEWSADTIEEVASILIRAGYKPKDES